VPQFPIFFSVACSTRLIMMLHAWHVGFSLILGTDFYTFMACISSVYSILIIRTHLWGFVLIKKDGCGFLF
jgi:hypothetical protein